MQKKKGRVWKEKSAYRSSLPLDRASIDLQWNAACIIYVQIIFFFEACFAKTVEPLRRKCKIYKEGTERERVNQDLPRFIKEDEIWRFTLDSLFERPLIEVCYSLRRMGVSVFTAAAPWVIHSRVSIFTAAAPWVILADQLIS